MPVPDFAALNPGYARPQIAVGGPDTYLYGKGVHPGALMPLSLLQRFGFGNDRSEQASLERQLTALQMALATCRGVATRWQRRQRELVAALALCMLALGFALGVYREPIAQVFADLAAASGLTAPASDTDAGLSAYAKGNYETALKILRPLAEGGDSRAQTVLGMMYSRGRGVSPSNTEALRWFHLAADRGDGLAEFNLGLMYAEGQGVPQDQALAADWYRKAADQGNPQAQYNLGLWYARGDAGRPDNVRAHMWFNLAAASFPDTDIRDRSAASSSRDALAKIMTSAQIAEAQRLAREWKASSSAQR